MSSRVRLVVVMDPIGSIKPAKDTTLGILLAAQARGWQLFYAEQKDLWLRDGIAWGRLAPLQVFDDLATWFTLGQTQNAKLGEFDVILMRKDPPFDTEYIYTTYILDRAELQGALVCNRPQGLRDMNEKVYTAWFPECCAPTLITRDMHDMSEFLREHGKAVCKPLARHGRQIHFRARTGRQEPQCRVRDPDRLRHPVCHCAALSAGNRHCGRLPDHSGGWRARAVRLAADAQRPRTIAATWQRERGPRAARSMSATAGSARKLDPNCGPRA